jgi:hypothetical protein
LVNKKPMVLPGISYGSETYSVLQKNIDFKYLKKQLS